MHRVSPFGNTLQRERGEVVKNVQESLEQENIQAATQALDAGFSQNEPWALKAERIIQSHVRPSMQAADEADNPDDSASALTFAEKVLNEAEKDRVDTVLLRLGHGNTPKEQREDALKQIYNHIEDKTSTSDMDELDQVIPGGLAAFLHEYKLEYAEQRNLGAFLNQLGNGTINWHSIGLPAGFIKEYNAQLIVENTPDQPTVHHILTAHGVDPYLASVPLDPNHEQKVAAHERIDNFRNLHHDAEVAQHLIQADASTGAMQEHFAPWQYLNAIGAENRVVDDLPLMNHREREFAFQSAIHAAYLELASTGKYDHGINTLINSSDYDPTGNAEET